MGADIKSLRTRIRSVDSTLHLTRAMGLVASSKIRRATANMGKSREYTAAMDEVVDQLRSAPECARSPYMTARGRGSWLIVIAGDRGLAGGYNANVFRLAATEPASPDHPHREAGLRPLRQGVSLLGAVYGGGRAEAGGGAVRGLPGGGIRPAGDPVYPVSVHDDPGGGDPVGAAPGGGSDGEEQPGDL